MQKRKESTRWRERVKGVMTDVLDYIRNLPPDPDGERRAALCVEHYRNLAGNRLMEMFPMAVHQVKVAKRLLEDGLVYTEEQALAKAGELIVQAKRKERGER